MDIPELFAQAGLASTADLATHLSNPQCKGPIYAKLSSSSNSKVQQEGVEAEETGLAGLKLEVEVDEVESPVIQAISHMTEVVPFEICSIIMFSTVQVIESLHSPLGKQEESLQCIEPI